MEQQQWCWRRLKQIWLERQGKTWRCRFWQWLQKEVVYIYYNILQCHNYPACSVSFDRKSQTRITHCTSTLLILFVKPACVFFVVLCVILVHDSCSWETEQDGEIAAVCKAHLRILLARNRISVPYCTVPYCLRYTVRGYWQTVAASMCWPTGASAWLYNIQGVVATDWILPHTEHSLLS